MQRALQDLVWERAGNRCEYCRMSQQYEDASLEIDHIIPECGAPVLIGAAAHFECRNEYRHYGGDHVIFIGHVERYAYTNRPTLLFCRGKYMRGEPLIPP